MSGVQGDKGYFVTFVSLVASNDPQSSRAQTAASGPFGASGLRAPGSQRSAELPRSSPSGASGLRAPSAELPRSSSGWATCPPVARGLRTTAPTPPCIRRSSELRRLWRWRWHKWGAPEEGPAERALVPFRFRVQGFGWSDIAFRVFGFWGNGFGFRVSALGCFRRPSHNSESPA